jgi:hypothetical protein
MTALPSSAAFEGVMAITVGSKIYLFCFQYTYVFDPTANSGLGSFTRRSDAPINRTWATCAYANIGGQDRIYLIAGYNWATRSETDANYYYNVGADAWSPPQAVAPYAAYGTLRENPVYGGMIYYGFGNAKSFYSDLYAYNPSANSWSSLLSEASYPRDGAGCGFINGSLYVIGGRDVSASSPYGLTYNEVCTQVIANDIGADVYLNSESRPDFGDIRFSWWNSSSNSEQPCDYWLESYTLGQTAVFWVKVPQIASNANNTIYTYYGNAQASTTSNGTNLFPFFDDFNRQNSPTVGNGWTEDSDPNGALSISNGLLEIYQYENYYCHVEQPAPDLSNFTLNGKIEINSTSGMSWAPMIYAYWGSYDWIGIGPNTWPANSIRSHKDVASSFSETTTASSAVPYGTWVYLRIRVTSGNVYAEWSADGSTWTTSVSISRPSSWSGAPSLIIVGKGYAEMSSSYPTSNLDNNFNSAGRLGTSYADDIFVSNYASPEPSQGSWGTEESAIQSTSPSFGSITANTTTVGSPVQLSCPVSSSANVSCYIYSWNNTGSWANQTATRFTNFINSSAAYATFSSTWNTVAGSTVSVRIYANDTSNNWEASSQYNFAISARAVENVFSVASNSTVSDLSFNSTSLELSFTVAGPSGTTGLTRVTIAKTLVANVTNLKVFLDGKPLQYSATETGDSWMVSLKYTHSTHHIMLALNPFRLRGDVNNDGRVNVLDVSIVATAFGSKPLGTGWNSAADLDNNGIINIVDIAIVATECGNAA